MKMSHQKKRKKDKQTVHNHLTHLHNIELDTLQTLGCISHFFGPENLRRRQLHTPHFSDQRKLQLHINIAVIRYYKVGVIKINTALYSAIYLTSV